MDRTKQPVVVEAELVYTLERVSKVDMQYIVSLIRCSDEVKIGEERLRTGKKSHIDISKGIASTLISRHNLHNLDLCAAEKFLVEKYLTIAPLPQFDAKLDSMVDIARIYYRRNEELIHSNSLIAAVGLFLSWFEYKNSVIAIAREIGDS